MKPHNHLLQQSGAMTDLMRRLNAAVPGISAWIDELITETQPLARKVATLAHPRLSQYFDSEVLSAAEVAVVDKIPFPPVSTLGLPEFEPMTTMPMAGITYKRRFFVLAEHHTESLCAHELVHVVQWAALGVRPFLRTYGLGIAQHGYEASPPRGDRVCLPAHL